jgi:transcription initiation factor TFIIIB Brf1 subunit/transcription initiation factor TFIIB
VYERNKRAFLAALIVTVSRTLNHPRVAKEVASVLGLRQGDVHREVKGIEKALGRSMGACDDMGVATAGDIVPRIMRSSSRGTPRGWP